jgi:CheY-like chemotaxis protein
MKLRTNLLVLVIGAMTPLLAVLFIGGEIIMRHEREAVAREALGRARSAMSAVDAELRGSLTVMQALASSRYLASGDLSEFYEEARRVLASQPDWLNIGLTTAAGVQVIDAAFPYGQHKPLKGDEVSFRLAVKTGKPAFGNVSTGAAVREPSIRIRMPVVQQGTIRYVLSVPIRPSRLVEVLRAQRIPSDWIIALVDQEKKYVARIPEAPAGAPVPDSFREAIDRAPEDWLAGRTLEGTAAYTPYVTSELTGWVLGIAIPAAVVEAGASRGTLVAGSRDTHRRGDRDRPRISHGRAHCEAHRGIGRRQHALRQRARCPGARRRSDRRDRPPGRGAARGRRAPRASVRRGSRNRRSKCRRPTGARTNSWRRWRTSCATPLRRSATPRTSCAIPERPEAEMTWSREVIERQVRHMARLLDDLLDVSRISSGKLELRRERCVLAAIVESARETSEPFIQDGGHELAVELPLEPVRLEADPVRLSQVLSNLLNNAARYTPARRPHRAPCRAALARADGTSGRRRRRHSRPRAAARFRHVLAGRSRPLTVAGWARDRTCPRARDRGGARRNDRSTQRGTGQGKRVRRSTADRNRRGDAAGPCPRHRRARSRASHSRCGRRRGNAVSLAAVLRGMGHDVHTASSGEEAVAAAARLTPEVVLLDIQMPQVDGYDACRRIREMPRGREMLIVAVTGRGQEQDRARSARAGFDHHFVKPVDPTELNALIRRLG